MPKFWVKVRRIVTQTAAFEVEAEDESDAYDKAEDKASFGGEGVEWEADDDEVEVTDVDEEPED